MPDLPRGTVTFLFTDIEGSTRLLQEFGPDGYAGALAAHRRALRAAFARHRGVEVDTQGDAFFVAFERASDAVAAACDIAATDGPLRMRTGVHSGEPHITDEGYVGLDVHTAARICAAAHGGQVLVSEATAGLVAADLTDLGLHRLKDLDEAVRVFQAGNGTFPPLRAMFATNLPAQPTPFVGRGLELADVARLVRATRIVTLTGVGGSGKTRLALQVAAAVAAEFEDGVFWVPLQALRDPELVMPSIAAALGAPDDLAKALGARRTLLLLDNFEQVIDAASSVASLVAACPRLSVLVTSREPLRVAAEREYVVEPLRESDAVALFLDRAVHSSTEKEAAPICRKLDNLPLAIELAAANLRVLDASTLLARLDNRLDTLTRGARDAPERQRTLRGTLAWSVDLLDDEERRVFRELAVFAGGCTIEDAEVVCGASAPTIASLVDKSLVRREGERFTMLETVREYALELLGASGDREPCLHRHAEWMARRALEHPVTEYARDRDNWRAAVGWSVDHDEPELAATLVANAGPWRVPQREQRPIARSAIGLCSGRVPPRLETALLRTACWLEAFTGDRDAALALARRALELSSRIDARDEVESRNAVAILLAANGGLDAAAAMAETTLELARSLEDPHSLRVALHCLGELERDRGNFGRARPLLDESIAISRSDVARRVNAAALHARADLSLEEGDAVAARRDYAECLQVAYGSQSLRATAHALAGLAALAAAERRTERASVLWGAMQALTDRIGVGLDPSSEERYERRLASLDPHVRERSAAAGRELELDAIVEYALSNVD